MTEVWNFCGQCGADRDDRQIRMNLAQFLIFGGDKKYKCPDCGANDLTRAPDGVLAVTDGVKEGK